MYIKILWNINKTKQNKNHESLKKKNKKKNLI